MVSWSTSGLTFILPYVIQPTIPDVVEGIHEEAKQRALRMSTLSGGVASQ